MKCQFCSRVVCFGCSGQEECCLHRQIRLMLEAVKRAVEVGKASAHGQTGSGDSAGNLSFGSRGRAASSGVASSSDAHVNASQWLATVVCSSVEVKRNATSGYDVKRHFGDAVTMLSIHSSRRFFFLALHIDFFFNGLCWMLKF